MSSPISTKDRELLFRFSRFIDANLGDTGLLVSDYALMLSMSRIQLYRRIKSVTGKSPSVYIRNYRLQKAAAYIANGEQSIGVISERVGFSSPKYFSTSFKKLYGRSPRLYQSKCL